MDLDIRKMIKKDHGGYALVFPNYCALNVNEIREIFSRFGPVRSVNLTGDQCGYRFVRYEKFEYAKSAIEGLRLHPEINLCTHGPRRKIDGNNNNNSGKGNMNVTRNGDEETRSVVGSDGSEDWEDSTAQQGARSSKSAGSSVTVGYNSRSRKRSASLSSQPGSLRETAAAAPHRNPDEKSTTRNWYKPNVWEKDRTPAGRSPGKSDADWRGTRDNSRSRDFEANNARKSSRSANNQGGTWIGTTVKTEDCSDIWDFARSSDSESTVRQRTVKTEDCGGIWNSAGSSNNQSNERSKTGRNDDCGSFWDSAVPWNNNHSTEHSKNVRNENCSDVWDPAVPRNNNHSTERTKSVRNQNCGGVWDSAVPRNNNHSTERTKNVRNGDRNSLGGSNRKLNCQSEVNWKTSRRNVKDESVSKSTDNIWNSIKNEQTEKPNQSIQQKSASNETVRICNSDPKSLSPKREINLHSRLLNIQSLNNQRNEQASKINADVDMDDECIPDLVQRKGQMSQKSEEVVIRNAKEVIVGNISEHATPAYILYLLEEYEPIAITHLYSAPKTCLRYCHVYFKKDKDALDAELQYDNYKLAGKRLIVCRSNRLTVLAAED